MTTKHTAFPWGITGPAEPEWGLSPTRKGETDFDFQEIHGTDGDLVALVAGQVNATLIVRAVTAYNADRAAMRDALRALRWAGLEIHATHGGPIDQCVYTICRQMRPKIAALAAAGAEEDGS